jgi:hypothetical protein
MNSSISQLHPDIERVGLLEEPHFNVLQVIYPPIQQLPVVIKKNPRCGYLLAVTQRGEVLRHHEKNLLSVLSHSL